MNDIEKSIATVEVVESFEAEYVDGTKVPVAKGLVLDIIKIFPNFYELRCERFPIFADAKTVNSCTSYL